MSARAAGGAPAAHRRRPRHGYPLKEALLIRNRSVITLLAFLSMFFLGIVIAVVGAAARNIGLTPAQIGFLISSQNVGFMVGVLVAGALSDTHEKPRLMLMGACILTAAFATFYMVPSLLVNMAVMFAMGAGIGIFEGVSDAMLLDIHDHHESLYINVNHSFVTLGSLVVTTYLIFLQMAWRTSMIQAAVAVGALAVLFAFVRLEPARRGRSRLGERLRFLREPAFLLAFVLLVLAVGTQMAQLGVMTTYLMHLQGFTQVTSKLCAVVFLAGIGIGRIIVGVLTRKGNVYFTLLLLFGLTGLGSFAFFLLAAGPALYVVAFLMGLTLSGLLPLLITVVGLIYRASAGTAMGVLKFAIPIGGIVVPLLFSVLSETVPFRRALIAFPLLFLLGFVVTLLGRRSLSAVPGRPATRAEPTEG